MEALNRNKIIVLGGVALISFAFGRYLTPEKIKIETKTEYVERTDKTKDQKESTNTDKDSHIKRTTTEITKPDGTVIRRTKTEKDTSTQITTDKTSNEKEVTDKRLTKEESKAVEYGSGRVIISGLVGLQATNPAQGFQYGLHVTKPILGPITFGVWGFHNLNVGLSLGLQF